MGRLYDLYAKCRIIDIRLSSEGEATVFERRKLLIEESELLTEKIAEMQECLERLQGKIKKYDRVLSRNKMECIK